MNRLDDILAVLFAAGIWVGIFALLAMGIAVPEWMPPAAVGGLTYVFGRSVPGNLALPQNARTFAPVLALGLVAGALALSSSSVSAQAPENPSTLEQGTIVLVQDTTPDNRRACFDFDVYYEDGPLTSLLLCDDDQTDDRFELVEPGTYTIRQHALTGYDGPDIDCTGVRETILPNGVRFELKAGAFVECTFTNDRTPEPTATATATATSTPTPDATRVPPTPAVLQPQQIIVVQQPAPTMAPPPVVAVRPASLGIRPPNTGDGGLLE